MIVAVCVNAQGGQHVLIRPQHVQEGELGLWRRQRGVCVLQDGRDDAVVAARDAHSQPTRHGLPPLICNRGLRLAPRFRHELRVTSDCVENNDFKGGGDVISKSCCNTATN